MTFIIILIGLLIERFWFAIANVRQWKWVARYSAWIERMTAKTPLGNKAVNYFLVVVPILIVVLIIQAILAPFAQGAWKIIFDFVVLLYCLGPDSFYQPLEQQSKSLFRKTHATAEAEQVIAKNEEDLDETEQQVQHAALEAFDIKAVIFDANNKIFAPLFWFALLGPFGAVLYRLTEQLLENDFIEIAKSVLDWIPVRLFGFGIALVSYFVEVFPKWFKYLVRGLNDNRRLLETCVSCALKKNRNVAHLLALIDRAIIVWLVVLALIVLL